MSKMAPVYSTTQTFGPHEVRWRRPHSLRVRNERLAAPADTVLLASQPSDIEKEVIKNSVAK